MELLKKISLFSTIFGLAAGVAGILPVIGLLVFLVLIFATAPVIFFSMKRIYDFKIGNEGRALSLGALTGFVSFLGFAFSFLPISFILSFVFKNSYLANISLLLKNGFTLTFMLIIFVGFLSAMMNAFSGLACIYFFKENGE